MNKVHALLLFIIIIISGISYFLLYERAYAPVAETKITDTNMNLKLSSSAFDDGEFIPAKYTCDGESINPPLSITGVPEGAESLVLVMDDSDLPEEIKQLYGLDKFNHWAVYNLPANTTEIPENSNLGTTALHTRNEAAYTGPCPPPEYEPATHRYNFRLYAITGKLNFIKAPTLDEVEEAAKSMMLDKAELTGLYTRVSE